MKIVRLSSNDVNSVINIFINNAKGVPYFEQLAKSMNTTFEDYVKSQFSEQFSAILHLGASYGIIEDNTLVGYNLMFSVKEMEMFNPEMLNKIFTGASTLKSIVSEYSQETYFIITIGTTEEFKSERHISKLLRTSFMEVGTRNNFVSDIVDNDVYGECLKACGFTRVVKKGISIWENLCIKKW